METLFELSYQDQTLNPQVGTFTDASQTVGTFTLEDGEYYLTNADTKGFYAYSPVALQSGPVDDSKVIIEFDLKVVTASANTHTIIGTYAGVDGNGVPTGAKITVQYNAGDIELVLDSGTTETLIESADVVVDQWHHFRIDCALAPTESTYEVKIDGVLITTVTGATTDYELGIISVLGTDLHACDECGIKNITFVTETDLYVGRTALDQALWDVKGYVGTHCMDLASAQTATGDKTFAGTTTTYDVIPATTDTYDIGSSTKEYNNAYIKALTVNGTAAGDILTHSASEFVPVSGGAVMSGDTLARTVNNSFATYCGGNSFDNGASVRIYGKDVADSAYAGTVLIRAKNNSDWLDLFLKPDGTATWGNKNLAMQEDVVPRSGGAVMTGVSLGRTVENSSLRIDGGNGYLAGASISLFGRYVSGGSPPGAVVLTCSVHGSTKGMLLYPDGSWTWEGSAVQLVSDQRYKQQISEIDDKLLDAWEDVELSQFKYNDAVGQKGTKARLHTGYVVQQIDAACKEHGVDVSKYGLYCHEEYPERTEEVEVLQKDGTIKKETRVIEEASEHYSLRYTEVYAVECMYLRRCIARLTARIEELEKSKEQEDSK